ncbi:hypothetical protein NDU88_009508 [Pleurodeles waltl]|uniref:Uncharacterized protein n=1 Tax=Pleurodeles waltl TaxID=8319 RepID=A0AAV7PV58_PLEWA|nr:hypothetical protein NDU88_009508 [Pleurodeles waltl]
MFAHHLCSHIHASTVKTIYTGPTTKTEKAANAANAFRTFIAHCILQRAPLVGDPSAYLEDVALTPQPDDEARVQYDPVRSEEVISALAWLKPLKAPGPEGFTLQFSKPSAKS